jgi:hypothetical protein
MDKVSAAATVMSVQGMLFMPSQQAQEKAQRMSAEMPWRAFLRSMVAILQMQTKTLRSMLALMFPRDVSSNTVAIQQQTQMRTKTLRIASVFQRDVCASTVWIFHTYEGIHTKAVQSMFAGALQKDMSARTVAIL